MRFLFVDKILEKQEDGIIGVKHFSTASPFRVPGPDGEEIIAGGVVGEAIGQCVSWLVIEKTDFKFRPVFAFMDKVEIFGTVKPGSDVIVTGTIDKLDEDTAVLSGEARVNGELVQKLTQCSHFLLPLEQTEFVDKSRERFAAISSEEGAYLDDDGEAYDFNALINRFEISADGKTTDAFCRVPEDAAFYADHFPKFPVTPIVVINEIIGKTLAHMVQQQTGRDSFQVVPKEVSRLKIKSFVKPGEPFEISVKERKRSGDNCEAMVTVSKDGKKILQGIYSFQLPEVV